MLSEREHNSCLVPWMEAARRLREKTGDPNLHVLDFFDLGSDGGFDRAKALAKIVPGVKVVAIGHSSNLDGTTIPDADLKAVSDAAHRVGAVLVVDGAQSVPHRRVDVRALGIDFLGLSIHKMCGPTGTGALYGRYDLLEKLDPVTVGGDTSTTSGTTASSTRSRRVASRRGCRTTPRGWARPPPSTTSSAAWATRPSRPTSTA